MVINAIEKAQRKVEGRNFNIRKNLLEYDDVANDQRKVVYPQRDSLPDIDDVSETITDLRAELGRSPLTKSCMLSQPLSSINKVICQLSSGHWANIWAVCGNFPVVRWRLVKPLLMLCTVSWTRS